MTAPDAAELMKLAKRATNPAQRPSITQLEIHTMAEALKSILSAPTEGEVAEVEKRHDLNAKSIEKGCFNFGTAWPTMRADRATLLRYIKSRPLQGVAERQIARTLYEARNGRIHDEDWAFHEFGWEFTAAKAVLALTNPPATIPEIG